MFINVYCDESCHLENDHKKAMSLGAIWCNSNKAKQINKEIRDIKLKHGISKYREIKWTKVSRAKIDYYLELIDYFFKNSTLHFRILVIPDKTVIQHKGRNQAHDDWYYKMYFYLIRNILEPKKNYKIFLDIKDTRGSQKAKKLREVLCNDKYDFSQQIIKGIKLVHSHEIEILGLADLLIGAVTYKNRELVGSNAKLKIIERIKQKSKYKLNISTLPSERKFNIFIWRPNGF